MKKLIFLLFIFLLVSCSSDDSNADDEMMDNPQEGPIVGEWTVINFGVVFDDGSEETDTDACGGAQKYRFLSDNTFEVDNFRPNGSSCDLDATRDGTYQEFDGTNFPNANFRLMFSDNPNDPLSYPEITFDGDNTMRVQYPWVSSGTDNIAFSFRTYQRD
ncbi:MAG: hypothetical protein AAF969_06905 [Bacteroidota bacterium]